MRRGLIEKLKYNLLLGVGVEVYKATKGLYNIENLKTNLYTPNFRYTDFKDS